MKKIILTFALAMGSLGFSQQQPKNIKTEFSSKVLSQKVISFTGKKVAIADIFKEHEGKVVLVDFWASWCRDCILALPKVQALKGKYPEMEFVYFSLDRSFAQWKKGLEKHNIADRKTYWFDEGWKNQFNDFVELNWVPRFILIDQRGKIAHYYAISPEDPNLISKIEHLLNK